MSGDFRLTSQLRVPALVTSVAFATEGCPVGGSHEALQTPVPSKSANQFWLAEDGDGTLSVEARLDDDARYLEVRVCDPDGHGTWHVVIIDRKAGIHTSSRNDTQSPALGGAGKAMGI
jgi:hypothetical protein